MAETPLSRAQAFGQAAKQYASAVAAFLGAAGWGVTQILEGSDALRGWYERMGLWPVIALIALGLTAVHFQRQRESVRAVGAALDRHTGMVSEAIQELRSRDQAHSKDIAALRAEVEELRAHVDTGPVPVRISSPGHLDPP